MVLSTLLFGEFPSGNPSCSGNRDSLFPPAAGSILNFLDQLVERDNTVSNRKDYFQMNLDVQHFKPEEISVLVGENIVIVEGNHEERKDEHGSISRNFMRRFLLPDDCDVEKLQSKLSSDGVLSITAPKKLEEMEYRQIPISRVGPLNNGSVQTKAEESDEETKNNQS